MANKEVGDSAYFNLIRTMGLKPLGYQNVAKDLEENGNEWYHAMIAIEDLAIVFCDTKS